jgi:SAM-dependent methyltransferase
MNFACPKCHSILEITGTDKLHCPADNLTFERVDGIWRFLLPQRSEYYARFVKDYEAVRRFEGRGSADKYYYRSLPYFTSNDWQIRATSFKALLEKVIVPCEKNKSPLQILDLGAGNSWLSNQLASRGHEIAAVDLTVNDFDGLGCYRFYDTSFLSFQAEFDHLPFPDRLFDLVLFNASFHYSTNYEETLYEAHRVSGDNGKIVVLDSPVYHDVNSGERMVREREEQFTRQYGFPSNGLKSENFLTYRRMSELGSKLGITWNRIRPYYGLAWATRPLWARLRGRREPAEFGLWVGSKLNTR